MVGDTVVRRSTDPPVRFGLKIWSRDTDLLDSAADLIAKGTFHYLELSPVPGTDIRPYLGRDIPCVIHAPTEQFGVNIADRRSWTQSRELIDLAFDWAARLRADSVILHPGFGSTDTASRFLEDLENRGILIENMPMAGLGGEPMVGFDPEGLSSLIRPGIGFCLDLNHAIKAAVGLSLNYRTFIRDLLPFGPALFHIADGTLGNGKDEHLPLGTGEYDIGFLRDCITRSPNPRVTFETPRSRRRLDEDLENLRFFLDA